MIILTIYSIIGLIIASLMAYEGKSYYTLFDYIRCIQVGLFWPLIPIVCVLAMD